MCVFAVCCTVHAQPAVIKRRVCLLLKDCNIITIEFDGWKNKEKIVHSFMVRRYVDSNLNLDNGK